MSRFAIIGVTIYVMVSWALQCCASEQDTEATCGDGTESRANVMFASDKTLRLLSWNIAAVNNNPFEYWITYDDVAYRKLMSAVQDFIDSPGPKDVLVSDIFTPTMFEQLEDHMRNMGWDSGGAVAKTADHWHNDYKDRAIVTEFLQDNILGLKRLISMPDRMTNTINVYGSEQAFRPAVHNCYSKGSLDSVSGWWKQWQAFMFTDLLAFGEGAPSQVPAKRLKRITRAKYPALTEAEETISIPLQTLLVAVFDAILVHMVNTVTGSSTEWQGVRRKLCEALNLRKNDRLLEILTETYAATTDVIFLQEVAGAFISQAREEPGLEAFTVLSPSNSQSTGRDQISAILVRKDTFHVERGDGEKYGNAVRDVTAAVEAALKDRNTGGGSVPVVPGDVFAVVVRDSLGGKYLLASFHGDTNGLATVAVVDAVHSVLQSLEEADSDQGDASGYRLLFGLDANTYEHAIPGKQQDVLEFAAFYNDIGLTSCWGDTPDPSNHTTFNARTFLQPQLNKAARPQERATKGDNNPKDFILFNKGAFDVVRTVKDNTGERRYVEDMVFPTLAFPSDHGALAVVLRLLHAAKPPL